MNNIERSEDDEFAAFELAAISWVIRTAITSLLFLFFHILFSLFLPLQRLLKHILTLITDEMSVV